MRKIRETLFSKKIALEPSNPYNLTLDILDSMATLGSIKEKKHEYKTDGPKKVVNLVFDLEDKIDDHSSIIFSFKVNGEHNGKGILLIDLAGIFNLRVDDREGLGKEAFSEFYFKNLFPSLKSGAEEKLGSMTKVIETRISELAAKYY